MFSRATKSVVKSFGSRRIHIDKKNFKIALIDDAGEISQTVSQLLINSAKLNTLALYDVAVVNKPLLANYNFCDKQPFKFIPSRMLTMAKKSCSGEGSHSNAAISMRYNNQQGNNGRNQIQKLVEALYHLPIAEEAPAIKGSLIPIEDLMPKLQPKEKNLTARLRESEIREAVKKFKQVEVAFPKSLLNASIRMLEKDSVLKTKYIWRPIFGTGKLELNEWNCKFYFTKMLNSGLNTKDFNSFKNQFRNFLLKHKAFDWTYKQSRKQFLKRPFKAKRKLPCSNKSTSALPICTSTASSTTSYLSFLTLYPFNKKYFLSSLPCHHQSVNLLRSVLRLKPINKSLFSKSCCEKALQSVERLESLKSSASSFKYLKHLKYLSTRKLSLPELCKQYSSSRLVSYSSYPHLLSQDVNKSIEEAPKRFSKPQRDKIHKRSTYRGFCYSIFWHRVHRRGFHSSLFSFTKSDSNKPSTCTTMGKLCKSDMEKTDNCGQTGREKKDVCHREKVKCDKSQQNKMKVKQKPKLEKKFVDSACKNCLPIGKCELPSTVPPPKMEYAKVTCPPPKFVRPKECPVLDDSFHIEIKQSNVKQKKKTCVPLPLPKPPCAPIVLCPCPPPPKVHPGPCPCYEMKEIFKQPLIQPCQLKKKYPCPTNVHSCPVQKKPCNLFRKPDCENRRKKETPAA